MMTETTDTDSSESSQSSPFAARKILILCVATFVFFLTWCCAAMWAPFFPGEAAYRGVSSTEVGFIFGTYSLGAVMASLIYGPFVIPRTGPNYILLAGLSLNGVVNLMCGFGDIIKDHVPFTVFFFIMRAVGSLGGAACETSIVVILTQEFPNHLPIIMGFLEIAAGLGFTAGPVIGGMLHAMGGFRLPMVAIGVTMLVFLPLMWILLPRRDYHTKSGDTSRIKLFKQLISIPGIMVMCLCAFLCMTSLTFLDPTLQTHAQMFGLDSKDVALLFLGLAAPFIFTSPAAGFILSRKSWGKFFILMGLLGNAISLLFCAPASFLTSFVPERTVWVLVLSLVSIGFYNGLYLVPVLPEMFQFSYEKGWQESIELSSFISGLFTGFTNLGSFFGAVIGGILDDHIGFSGTTVIISSLSFAQFLLTSSFFTYHWCSRKKASKYEPLNGKIVSESD